MNGEAKQVIDAEVIEPEVVETDADIDKKGMFTRIPFRAARVIDAAADAVGTIHAESSDVLREKAHVARDFGRKTEVLADEGKKFLGSVKDLMDKAGVKMVNRRPNIRR